METGQPAERVKPLEPSAPSVFTVTTSSIIRTPLRVGRREYVRLDVRSDKVEARVSVVTLAGQRLAVSGRIRDTTESLVLVGAAAGPVTIQVRAAPTSTLAGRVTVSLVERRPVERIDAQRIAAQRAYAAGWTLLEATPADVEAGRARFADAQQKWAQLGDTRMEARAWHGLGEAYDRLGMHAQALTAAERRGALARALGDRSGELWAANETGKQKILVGDGQAARDLLTHVVSEWQNAGDREGESAALVLLGAYHTSIDEKDAAEAHLSKAADLLRTDGDGQLHATALGQLGNYYNTFGARQRAIDAFSQAVKVVRESRGRRIEATIRHDFGTLYNMLGEYELSRGEFERSLRLARQTGDAEVEAHTLLNLGTNFADLNDLPRASRYLMLARPLLHKLGDERTEAILLNNLATFQHDREQPALALENAKAAYDAFVRLGMTRGQMISLTGMGLMLCGAQRYDEGRARLQDALRLAQVTTDRAQQALALAYRAECDAEDGALDTAHTQIDEAHALVEHLRAEILRDDLRSSFFSTARPILERKVDILMRLAEREPGGLWQAAAFEASEAARARSMLELIPALSAVTAAHVAPGLAAARDGLVAKLRAANSQDAGAGDLLAEYYALRARIRAEQPAYAELSDPRTLTAAEAQGLLPPGTVALEYLLGRTRGHLWIITGDRIEHATLPGRAEIERLVRPVMTAVRYREAKADPAGVAAADERYRRSAAVLSRLLLKPLTAIPNVKQVLVVPDGVLHLVPFAALPLPARSRSRQPTPLVDAAEVRTIASLSVLASRRPTATGAPIKRRVAVIARSGV